MRKPAQLVFGVLSGLLVVAAQTALAVFPGTDVVVPLVMRTQGEREPPAQLYSTLWLTNESGTKPASVVVQFYQRDAAANPTASTTLGLAPSETRTLDDCVGSLLGLTGVVGSLRLTADQPVLVSVRDYILPPGSSGEGIAGQYEAAIPAAFAIGLGDVTELQGVSETSREHYSFGVVETTGADVTVTATLKDPTGAVIGSREYAVPPHGQVQKPVTDVTQAAAGLGNALLEITVTAGSGRILAYGTSTDDALRGSTTFEMALRPALLRGPATSDDAGQGSAPDRAGFARVGGGTGLGTVSATATTGYLPLSGGTMTGQIQSSVVNALKIAPSTSGADTMLQYSPNISPSRVWNWNWNSVPNPGDPNRSDVTANFGYNNAPGGGCADQSDPCIYTQFEDYFAPDLNAYSEYHLNFFEAGNASSLRPFHYQINRSTGFTSASYTADAMGWLSRQNGYEAMLLDLGTQASDSQFVVYCPIEANGTITAGGAISGASVSVASSVSAAMLGAGGTPYYPLHVTGTSDTIQALIQGTAGQTQDLTRWIRQDGSVVMALAANGMLYSRGTGSGFSTTTTDGQNGIHIYDDGNGHLDANSANSPQGLVFSNWSRVQFPGWVFYASGTTNATTNLQVTGPISATNTVGAAGGFVANGAHGITTTITVRNAGGAGDCAMTFTGGILTATTCSHT